MVNKATILSAIANYGFKIAMGMFAKDDFDAAVGEMTGGGINKFTGGKGVTGLIKNQSKKFAMNKLLSGNMGGLGGMALPLAGGLALGYMTNPLREGSSNYNPELQGQIDYASGQDLINRDNSMNALRYNEDSVLRGQNVISGFGTNDYMGQLQKNLKRLEGYKNPNDKTFEMIERTKAEIEDLTTHNFDEVDKFIEEQEETPTVTETVVAAPAYVPTPAPTPAPVYYGGGNDSGGGGGSSQDNAGGGASANRGDAGSGWDSSPFAKGGIANINIKKRKLGELLRWLKLYNH